MKFHSVFILLLILALILIPIAAIGEPAATSQTGDGSSPDRQTPNETRPPERTSPADGEENLPEETVKVFSPGSKSVEEVALLEYLVGAVAAEMPAGYHTEALKAQAVACHTYLQRQKRDEARAPTSSLEGADISDESGSHQGYCSEARRRELWGTQFEANEKKVREAVEAVRGTVLRYEGEPILAAFHAISAGQTETAGIVWGEELPYLQSVLSTGDKLSPDYAKTLALTQRQFRERAEKLEGVRLGEEPAKWAGTIKHSDAGMVISVVLGGTSVSGTQVREAFGLPSAAFEIQYNKDGSFQIKTKGYGHGVGMSQYGADYMARQGSDWEEILKHYYSGVEIAGGK